eukprot:9359397-Prorocentrum_lima.AAC.1
MAPTRVAELRALMAKSSGLRKQGGCCTVALFFGFGTVGDPASSSQPSCLWSGLLPLDALRRLAEV